MDSNELRDLGQQIARDIAGGMIQGMAAGAAEFRATMAEARRQAEHAAQEAETDQLTRIADGIEAQRQQLVAAIAGAKGLKKVALERRLAQLDAAEAELVAQVERPKAIEAPPAGDGKLYVREGRKFAPLNGTH